MEQGDVPKLKRFDILLALLIAVTIGIRLWGGHGASDPNDEAILRPVEDFLRSIGAETVGKMDSGTGTISMVTFRDCNFYLSVVKPYGENSAVLQRSVQLGQSLRYIYDGRILRGNRPHLKVLAERYIRRLLNQFGFDVGFPYVLGLIADDSCDLSKIHWEDLPKVGYQIK